MGCLPIVKAHNDPQLIVDALESEEYRYSFDYHLLAPPVVQLISCVISGVTSLAAEHRGYEITTQQTTAT